MNRYLTVIFMYIYSPRPYVRSTCTQCPLIQRKACCIPSYPIMPPPHPTHGSPILQNPLPSISTTSTGPSRRFELLAHSQEPRLGRSASSVAYSIRRMGERQRSRVWKRRLVVSKVAQSELNDHTRGKAACGFSKKLSREPRLVPNE